MSLSTPANTKRRVICVYCGSRSGKSPAHLEAARSLAKVFHEHNIQLVYGGGTMGLMGEVAKTLVSLSGPDAVFGIIPDELIKYERTDRGGNWVEDAEGKTNSDPAKISEHEAVFGRTMVVGDMHSRKRLMARKVMEGGPGSGFVALTGGYGTLEELMEMTTWNQLGIHACGVCVFNVNGFWDGLLDWINMAVKEELVSENNRQIIITATTAEEVEKQLAGYVLSKDRYKLDWVKA